MLLEGSEPKVEWVMDRQAHCSTAMSTRAACHSEFFA